MVRKVTAMTVRDRLGQILEGDVSEREAVVYIRAIRQKPPERTTKEIL